MPEASLRSATGVKQPVAESELHHVNRTQRSVTSGNKGVSSPWAGASRKHGVGALTTLFPTCNALVGDRRFFVFETCFIASFDICFHEFR